MTKGNQLQLLVCTANMGNAQPDEASLNAWIPADGKCTTVLQYPAKYPVPNQFSTFDEYMETDQFDLIVVGMQEATWFEEGAQLANMASYVASHDHLKSTRKASMEHNKVPSFGASVDGASSVDTNELVLAAEASMDKDNKKNKGGAGDGGTRVLHGMLDSRLPSYTRTVSFQRGQMRLEVYVLSSQNLQVAVVHTAAQNTGRAGLANKGGIVTELLINGKTRLSFITAHLEAHEGTAKYWQRVTSLADILAGTTTRSGRHDVSVSSHYSFCMGDLNFRTGLEEYAAPGSDEAQHKQQIRNLVQAQDWGALNDADELHQALEQKHCLVGFSTLPCNFPPTFKMERQVGYQYIEKRRPSYTDRILYKAGHELERGIRPLLYEPVDNFSSSDHKPVRAAFAVTLNQAMAFRPRAARRRSAIQMLGSFQGPAPTEGVVSRSHRLQIFLSDMACELDTGENNANSKTSNNNNKAEPPNPYICLVSTPEAALQKSTIGWWERWIDTILFWRRMRKKKEKEKEKMQQQQQPTAPDKIYTADGWPQTSVQKQTFSPMWQGEEFNTTVKTYLPDGTPLDLTGAMIHVTVMDARSSGGVLTKPDKDGTTIGGSDSDPVLGTFSYNLGNLVKSFRPPTKPDQAAAGGAADGGGGRKRERRGSIMDRVFMRGGGEAPNQQPDNMDGSGHVPGNGGRRQRRGSIIDRVFGEAPNQQPDNMDGSGHVPGSGGRRQRRGSIMDRVFRRGGPDPMGGSGSVPAPPAPVEEPDPVKTIPIDAPLVRNGLETGRIRFTMEAWWMDESTAKILGGIGLPGQINRPGDITERHGENDDPDVIRASTNANPESLHGVPMLSSRRRGHASSTASNASSVSSSTKSTTKGSLFGGRGLLRGNSKAGFGSPRKSPQRIPRKMFQQQQQEPEYPQQPEQQPQLPQLHQQEQEYPQQQEQEYPQQHEAEYPQLQQEPEYPQLQQEPEYPQLQQAPDYPRQPEQQQLQQQQQEEEHDYPDQQQQQEQRLDMSMMSNGDGARGGLNQSSTQRTDRAAPKSLLPPLSSSIASNYGAPPSPASMAAGASLKIPTTNGIPAPAIDGAPPPKERKQKRSKKPRPSKQQQRPLPEADAPPPSSSSSPQAPPEMRSESDKQNRPRKSRPPTEQQRPKEQRSSSSKRKKSKTKRREPKQPREPKSASDQQQQPLGEGEQLPEITTKSVNDFFK